MTYSEAVLRRDLTGKTRHVWRTCGIFKRFTIRVFQVEKHCISTWTDCGEHYNTTDWFDATPDDMELSHEMNGGV